MNHHSDTRAAELTPGLKTLLTGLRADDSFDALAYADKKAFKLNCYMAMSRLSACVVAVSGGVDSALVLALVHHASKKPDSPIKRIVPVMLPVFTPGAATNQDVATARGIEVCEQFGLTPIPIDLSGPHAATKGAVDKALATTGAEWASGQLVAYQRTSALYYVTSLMSQQGTPSILVGTTNEDEGSYLGYFGKASDGLVDVQLISDLSKHRVFEVAAALGVPQSILNAVPTGDMYDGRVDEEVFGAPYDFVELFLRYKKAPNLVQSKLKALDVESKERFALLRDRLEALHGYNAHKYLGRSPAVHLDLTDTSFPGSWNYSVFEAGFFRQSGDDQALLARFSSTDEGFE